MDKKTFQENLPGFSESNLKETLKFLEGNVEAKKPGYNNKGKRGNYKQKECPYCHQMVGNLGNHVKMKHQAEVKDNPAPPPRELAKQDLIPGAEPKIIQAHDLTVLIYYCQDCKAELRKGEMECWNCHAVLNWEGI